MSAPVLSGSEPVDELLFLGIAVAHVALYRERQRLARIEASNREALRRACGVRGRGGVVSFA